jgi:hypothetical protein
LINTTRPPAFTVDVPVTPAGNSPDPQGVELQPFITAALRDRTLRLLSLEPQRIDVRFDRKVELDVAIQTDAGTFAETLAGTLKVDPPTVKAIVLSSALRDAGAPVEPRLIIPLEDELRSGPPQRELKFVVPLRGRKLQGLDVAWQPDSVQISGSLRETYSNLELKMIPLRVVLPWNWPCDQYRIEWVDERDRLQKVEIKVPVGKPTVLTSNDVVALVRIDESLVPPPPPADADPTSRPAAEPSPLSQAVRFVFPENFEDVKIVSPPSIVKFRILRRDAAPEPAGP